MKRLLPTRMTCLVLLALLTLGAAVSAQDLPTITLTGNGGDLTVDDDFSDWDDLPTATNLTVLKTQNNTGLVLDGTDDLAASVKMTYDEDNLYILVDVIDDTIWTENEAQPWHNDGIEISLLMTDDEDLRTSWSHNSEMPQPGQQKIFYNVGWSTETVVDKSNSAEGDYSNASVTTRINGTEDDPTGYTVQFVLPWAAINNDNEDFDPAEAGTRFSMNIAVNDNDNTPFPGNADNNDRREHTLLWLDANMNNQGDLFGYVQLQATESMESFSDDAYFGNTANYTFFANPQGAQGASVDDWTVQEQDGDPALVLTNADVNPTHPSGDPFFNPDADLYSNGQFSAPGARAIAADTSFEDFEMVVDMKRPDDQTSNFYDLAVLFGYEDENNFAYANFGIHPTEATATIVPIVDGEGLRTAADPRFTGMLPVFPNDDDYHQVLLRREGTNVALFIDGEAVMFADGSGFANEGAVGVGSWNDNGIFDNISVTALTGDYTSKMSFIASSTTGTLTFDGLTNVTQGLSAGQLLSQLTLTEGATAEVQDADGAALATGAALDNSSMIVVTAAAGNTKSYTVSITSQQMDVDNKIDAVFAPVRINDDSTEVSTVEGTDVALLLDRIRHPASATEQVIDADGEVITDSTTLITEEMQYQIVAATGEVRNYTISLYAPTFPTAQIGRYDDIVIDAFFDEWEDVEPRFDIAGTGTGGALSDTMPSEDDISGFFKAAWDDEYLYLYFNVTDEVLNTSAEQSFRNDGIEIALLTASSIEGRSQYNLFFDQANQPGNQKFVYTWGADWAKTFENSGLGPFNKSATLFEGAVVEDFAKEDGSGYEVEMQIPWSGLNQNDSETSDEALTPQIGESFSLNVALNDNDGGDERQSVKYWAHPQLNRDGADFGIITLTDVVSTRTPLGNFALEVFPNPTDGRLMVTTDKKVQQLAVFSITGQQLLTARTNSVDLSALSAGTYLLRVLTDDNYLKVVRFVKN